MIDRNIRNINELFNLRFKAGEIYTTRIFFDKYYMSLVEIKNLINNETCFAQAV